MKLYEIDAQIESCIDMETGEILDKKKLDALEMEREEKIENVVCWIKSLKAEAEALKAEKDAFAARQKTAENKAESLKEWLKYVLNGKKFKTTKASVSFRNNESVKITDLDKLVAFDDTLVKYSEPEPCKAKIKEAIKAGREVQGAVLEEGRSVIIK